VSIQLPTTEAITIRVQSSLLGLHGASGLWYLARALDKQGEGKVIISPEWWQRLEVAKSTIYRWLREGEVLGLFRRYWWRGNTLHIILGGLTKVCIKSGIKNWGAAAVVPLEDAIHKRRQLASAITTQDLQDKSHYAARQQLNQLERRCFDIPEPDQLLNCQTSSKMTSGGTRGVVHVGRQRLFVGRSFIPYGVSQKHVCEVLNSQPGSCGFSRWTLQRHLKQLDVVKRQVVQAKPEYKEITTALKYGSTHWKCKSDANISFHRADETDVILDEPAGKSSARKSGGHRLHIDRFFPYFGAVWLYRNNIYGLDYQLSSMKALRRKLKGLRNRVKTANEPVENSIVQITPQTPQMHKSPQLHPVGVLGGDHNKGSKNDNSCPDRVTAYFQQIYGEPDRSPEALEGMEMFRAKIREIKARSLEKRRKRLTDA
jgi:hypothetical protein